MEEHDAVWNGETMRWQRPEGKCSRNGCDRTGRVRVKWQSYTVGDLMCDHHARTLKARFPHLIV